MKYYTLGEIYRLGLLKNYQGKPYTAKATISRIVAKLSPRDIKTPWGMAKCLTKDQIDSYNKNQGYDKE